MKVWNVARWVLVEAHYDLKRTGQLLQDTLERLATGPKAGRAVEFSLDENFRWKRGSIPMWRN